MLRAGFSAIAFFLFFSTSAQQIDVVDTTHQTGDTVLIRKGGRTYTADSYTKRFNPRKALLYSAIAPGMGQVYNKKYWKLPIVYGGFYLFTYVAFEYNKLYNTYKTELFGLIKDPTYVPPSGYTEAQLRSITETYRRQRDFFLILDGLWYLLQIVDAHVDAHLKEFDLNPQLKVSLQPTMLHNSFYGQASGFSVTIKF